MTSPIAPGTKELIERAINSVWENEFNHLIGTPLYRATVESVCDTLQSRAERPTELSREEWARIVCEWDEANKGQCRCAKNKNIADHMCSGCVGVADTVIATLAGLALRPSRGEGEGREQMLLAKLFAKACPYCAADWPMSDDNDGVDRKGRYHARESQYSPGFFGGGFVECKAADERALLSAPRHPSPKAAKEGGS